MITNNSNYYNFTTKTMWILCSPPNRYRSESSLRVYTDDEGCKKLPKIRDINIEKRMYSNQVTLEFKVVSEAHFICCIIKILVNKNSHQIYAQYHFDLAKSGMRI